jgi:hypothetical protein
LANLYTTSPAKVYKAARVFGDTSEKLGLPSGELKKHGVVQKFEKIYWATMTII